MPFNRLLAGAMAGLSITYPVSKTTLSYTGAEQTYTVPSGVTRIRFKAWGGAGGALANSSGRKGGSGGFTKGEIAVTPGEVLRIVVGGGSAPGSSAPYGFAGSGINNCPGGGGLTGIFRSSVTQANALAIAGGGGGGVNDPSQGGPGGGSSGLAATSSANNGGGGTQSAGGSVGGSALQGGSGTAGNAAGGGGGYYGGGSGGDNTQGGGGSGYIGGCVSDGTQSVAASTQAGSGITPPSTGDSDYAAGIGVGGTGGGTTAFATGGNGRLVIY